MALVCKTKLRVRMNTGLGRPVDPDVKLTIPGDERNGVRTVGDDECRGSGRTTVRSPSGSPAGANAARDGGRKRGVPAGIGGEVRQALESGGRIATGRGRLDSAKKSATTSGRLARGRAASSAVDGIEVCTRSSQPAAMDESSSEGQSLPLKRMDGGRNSSSRSVEWSMVVFAPF
jgi:hypothetical protein